MRWYLRYRLSDAEVVEWLAERGIMVDPIIIYDWVQAFTPRFIDAARTHRSRIGFRWRVDETFLKISSRWRYLYRAIDEHGQIVDVYLSDHRTADAARTFFQHAIGASGVRPIRLTTDKARSYPKALQAELPDIEHRSSKYLNNGLERDHQHLKQCLYPMRGFKSAASADLLARGHAFIQNLRNGFSRLTASPPRPLRLMTAWSQLTETI